MESNQLNCQNCEQPYKEGFNFCPSCGQKTNEELTIGVLFYNTISNYFSFDARFLKSFIPLMFKPGYLAKKFLEGKRLLYLHPAQMYLFVSVIFFFVFSFTVNDWIKEANKANKEIAKSDTLFKVDAEKQKVVDSVLLNVLKNPIQVNGKPLIKPDETQKVVDSIVKSVENKDYVNTDFGISKKQLDSLRQAGTGEEEIYKEIGMDDDAGLITRSFYKSLLGFSEGKGLGNLIKRFVDTIPIAMFFLLPLFAIILKIFYFRRGPYAYHLVFSFYFFSFLFTVFSLIVSFNRFVTEIPMEINWLIVLSTFVYFYLALLNFYNRNWFTTLIKSGVITFIFLLMVMPFASLLIGAFAVINA